MHTKWLENFKIAIIEQNFPKLEELLESMPEIKSINDLKTTVALINEAKKLLANEQKILKENMAKINKSKKFFDNLTNESSFSKSC